MPVMWPQFRPLMLRPTIASVTGKSRATDLCDSPFLQRATIFKTSALVSFFPGRFPRSVKSSTLSACVCAQRIIGSQGGQPVQSQRASVVANLLFPLFALGP